MVTEKMPETGENLPVVEPSPLTETAQKLDEAAGREQKEKQDKFKGTHGIQDVLGDGKIHFFEDLPRVDFKELIGREFVLHQVKYIDKWDSIFGTSSYYLMMIELDDGRKMTTLGGGKAIINQLNKMTKMVRAFPCRVTLNMQPSATGEYYVFE